MTRSPVVAVVGPTAAGKTALGVRLALELGGEVVNADSMQVYRGMDVGTAKATLDERAGVPHHLLDVIAPDETMTVADYQQRARASFADVRSRGGVPVLVGGSGLYVQAALDHLDFPGTDEVIRARLEAELAEVGPEVLHARLSDVDPAAAQRIHPSNGRRTVRALEVVELTGAPFSRGPGMEFTDRAVDALVVGLDLDPEHLDATIDRRVDQMWQRGLVDEVRALEPALRRGVTSWRALGYRQLLDHLAGECTEDEARTRTQQATRRYVRRQRSWFRRDPRIRWVSSADDALGLVEQALKTS